MKQFYFLKTVATFVFVCLCVTAFGQVTLTTRATGNWNSINIWLSGNLTGTISTSTSSATVTGFGTSFTTQLAPGAALYRNDGTTFIGTIASVNSNTSITLTSNAANTNSNITFRVRKVPGVSDDVIINNNNDVTITANAICNDLTINGNTNNQVTLLTINTSVLLTVSRNFSIAGSTGNREAGITVNGILQFGGSTTFNSNNVVYNFDPGSTIEYNGNSDQTVFAIPGEQYANLTISGSSTKTLNSNITVNGVLNFKAGTTLNLSSFSIGTPNSLNIECGGALAGGQITGTGTLSVGGNITVIDAGNGTVGAVISCPLSLGADRTITVADDGTSATDLTLSGTINNAGFSLTKSGSGTLAFGSQSVTLNSLTISSGTLVSTSGTLNLRGNFSNTSVFTHNSGTVVFGATTGTQTLNSGGSPFHIVSHTGAGILQLTGNALTTNSTFTNASGAGNFDANGLAHTVNGLATLSAGSYLASSATQTFNGGLTINGGTFSGSSGTVSVTNLTLSNGVLTAPSGTFNVSGNWSRSGGTFTPGTHTVHFTGTSGTQQLNTGGSAFHNLSHTGAGTLRLLTNPLTINGTFTNSAGIFDANGLVTTVTGLATISGGTYQTGVGAQTFNGGLIVSGGTYNGLSGTQGNTSLTNLTISSGTFAAPGSTGIFTVGGNWTYNGGVFTHNSGTVQFSGSGVQTISGTLATGFHNANINNGNGVSVTGSAGIVVNNTLQLIDGVFNVSGSSLVFQNGNTPIVLTNGTLTTNSSTNLVFGTAGNPGGAAFTIPSGTFTSIPTINHFTINRTFPLTLGSQDITINGVLTLTSGIFSAGSNNVILGASATISGGSTQSHVQGNLRRVIATGTHSSLLFPVGDGTEYAPVSLAITGTVSAATGSITIRTTAGDHPNLGSSGINNTRSVNRYWTISQTSPVPGLLSYAPTFNYVTTDNDAGTTASAYVLRLYVNPNWQNTTLNGTPTTTQIRATGVQQFGEFAAGQVTGSISVSTHPVSQSVCAGSNVSFTASSASTPTPSVQWERDNGSGYQPITADLDPGVTYSGFTTGTLQITGANTSVNSYVYRAVFSNINGEVSSNGATLTVNSIVTPTVSLANSIASNLTFYSIAICAGTPVTFTAQASNTGGGTVTYNFKVNGVTVQSSTSSTYTSAAFQNSDLVSCDISISGGACLTSTTASTATTFTSTTVNVTSPSVSLSSSTGSTICTGTLVQFTAVASNTGGGNITYEFRKNGTPVQTVTTNLPTATYSTSNLADGDVLTCAISLTGGTCSGGSAVSPSLSITVITSFNPSVSLAVSPATTICAGSEATFTATASNTGGGNVLYQFFRNGQLVQSGASAVYTTSSLSNGAVISCQVTVTGGSCAAANANSNTVSMTVISNPVVTLSSNYTGAVCTGTPVTFTAASTNPGGGVLSYDFRVNGSSVQRGALTTYTYVPVNGDEVQCVVTVTGGTCPGATATSPLLTASVVNGFTPAVSLAVAPGATISAGATVTFTATANNFWTGSVTYTFFVNGLNVQTGASATYSSSALAQGDVVRCEISVTGGSCLNSTNAVSNNITIQVASYVWVGGSNSLWTNGANWSGGNVPAGAAAITIAPGNPHNPVLNNTIATITDLVIQSGATLTVNSSGVLRVSGTIQNAGTLNLQNGTLDLNGASVQSVSGYLFQNSRIRNLVISNDVTFTGPLQLTGTLSFGNVNNKTLISNGHLTLRSDATGTARVADLTNLNINTGNSITGLVTVEQYIPAARKWRGLSVPFKGNTNNSIFDNWQNGGVEQAGRGVLLWSPTGTGANGNGFSLNSAPGAAANIRGYGNGAFTTPTTTKTAMLFDENGPRPYIVFVTDQYRSAGNTGFMTSGNGATTLQAQGELITGSYSIGSLGSGYRMIANPYASAIDFATIGKSNVNNQFWVWDPKLTGGNGTGGYVYTANSGSGYISVPLGGSFNNSSTMIPAGGAFWVRVNDGFIGSLTFRETDKSAGGAPLLFGRNQADENQVLRVTVKDPAAAVTYDGVAAVFNTTSTKEVDPADAQKFSIGSENISIRRFTRDWAIEFRPLITAADTVFLRLHNMKQQSYSLEIQGEQFETNGQFTAVLQDLFLNTETPLNLGGVQRFSFAVTAATASTGDRFRIVFRQNVITSVGPDVNSAQGIQLFPNPVARGAETQVQFRNLKAGRYQFTLYALNGVRVMNEVLVHAGGTAVQKVRVASDLATGVYYAEIVNEKGWKERVKVVVE